MYICFNMGHFNYPWHRVWASMSLRWPFRPWCFNLILKRLNIFIQDLDAISAPANWVISFGAIGDGDELLGSKLTQFLSIFVLLACGVSLERCSRCRYRFDNWPWYAGKLWNWVSGKCKGPFNQFVNFIALVCGMLNSFIIKTKIFQIFTCK